MSKKDFESPFLNEQLKEGNVAIRTGMIAEGVRMVTGISGAKVVEVFPIENFNKILDKIDDTNKLRTKIARELKKEGFKFFSFSGTNSGHYVK